MVQTTGTTSLWEGAFDIVRTRLEGLNLGACGVGPGPATHGQLPVAFDDLRLVTKPFRRTDDGASTPGFETPFELTAPTPNVRARDHKAWLLDKLGPVCQGCCRDYSFAPRALEVDHVLPRADGGSDARENLTLLCPPCNRVKRDHLTLSGLRARNRQDGQWCAENVHAVKQGQCPSKRCRR